MRSTTTPIMCLCVSLSLHLVHKYDWSNGPSQFVCIVKIVSVAASQSVTFRHKCAFPSLSALPDPTQYNYNIRQGQRQIQRQRHMCVCAFPPLLVSLHAARSHSIHLPSALSQSCSFTFPPWVLDLVYSHSKHALFSQRLLLIVSRSHLVCCSLPLPWLNTSPARLAGLFLMPPHLYGCAGQLSQTR